MILEANHISYTYRTQKNIPVLHQISAGFQAGRFYSIIGSSGSGKTTFLSLLAGLDTPGEGVIQYDGEDIQKCGLNFHRRHHISLVFQNYNLIDYLTAQAKRKVGRNQRSQRTSHQSKYPTGCLEPECPPVIRRSAAKSGDCPCSGQ
mgnify:CR=1 FL=1